MPMSATTKYLSVLLGETVPTVSSLLDGPNAAGLWIISLFHSFYTFSRSRIAHDMLIYHVLCVIVHST